MKAKTFLVCLFLFLWSAQNKPVRAAEVNVAGESAQPVTRDQNNEDDPRVIKLESYLRSQNSELADYADVFISAADEYELEDYDLTYLVPAITGLESSYAKHYIRGTYNAYGWGGGTWKFDSWNDSIAHVTRVLRQKYIDKGANTITKIGPIYAESPTWAVRVAQIKAKIDIYEPLEARLDYSL